LVRYWVGTAFLNNLSKKKKQGARGRGRRRKQLMDDVTGNRIY
jgi:hypothetical protein